MLCLMAALSAAGMFRLATHDAPGALMVSALERIPIYGVIFQDVPTERTTAQLRLERVVLGEGWMAGIREAVLMWAELGTQHLGRYAPHASDDALQRFFSVAHDIALYQSQGDPCGGLRSTAIPASMGLRMMLALSDVVTSSDQARPSAGVVRRVANDTPPVAVPACGGNAAVLVALKELPAEQRMMVLRNGFGAPRTMVAGGSGTGHATGVLQ